MKWMLAARTSLYCTWSASKFCSPIQTHFPSEGSVNTTSFSQGRLFPAPPPWLCDGNEPELFHSSFSLTLYWDGHRLPIIGRYGGSCHCNQRLARHWSYGHCLGIHVVHRHRVYHGLLGNSDWSSTVRGVIVVGKQSSPCGIGCRRTVPVIQGGWRGGKAWGLRKKNTTFKPHSWLLFNPWLYEYVTEN